MIPVMIIVRRVAEAIHANSYAICSFGIAIRYMVLQRIGLVIVLIFPWRKNVDVNKLNFIFEGIWRGLFIGLGVVFFFGIIYTTARYDISHIVLLILFLCMVMSGIFFLFVYKFNLFFAMSAMSIYIYYISSFLKKFIL